MRELVISKLKNQFSVYPEKLAVDWETCVQHFQEHQEFNGDKANEPHFNGVEYKEGGRREYKGVKAIHILVLDYDDGLPLEEAKEFFKNYEHIGYTSYNHQVPKDGEEPVDKFRLLIPLVEPCPASDWFEIMHNVSVIAPGVDNSCSRPHQPFAVPIVRTNAPHESWHNEGEWLDWREWKRKPKEEVSFLSSAPNPALRSEKFLLPDDYVETKKGFIRVGDVTQRINGVKCPFHPDKKPGEFINRRKRTYLYCEPCKKSYYMRENEPDKSTKSEEQTKNAITELVHKHKRDHKEAYRSKPGLLDPSPDPPVMPFYRPQRKNLLIKGIKHIPSKTLLYAGEGFGKSSQTVMYLTKERGKKVIFSCLSNKQIEEQTESFGKQGLKVQTIHSREYIIKTKHNVEPVMLPPAHPWASNILDETKTRQAFLDAGYTQEKTDEIWDVLENNLLEPDFDNHDIVITTHARLRVWGMAQKKRVGHVKDKALASGLFDDKLIVDRGTCIIFDDPTIDEFMKFKKFDKRYETVVVDKERLKVVTIGGENGKKERRYFVRPQSYEATFGLRSVHWFFTTTELLVAYLISNLFPETKVPKLLPDVPMTTEGAKITVIRSKIVRSKCDGVLPVVFERLKKEEYKCEFFANGMGNEFNLTNSKGQNIFSDLDTIIEISLPHEDEAIVLADCLGTDNRQLVRETIALDALHQAIGRNCGYRSSDKTYTQDGQAIETRKCVVLIEPRLCNGILKRMRYCVAQLVEGDKYVQGQSKRDYTRFEDAVLWFVRNWESFLFRGITKKGKGSHREFEVCVRLAAVNCPADRRKTRAKRMLKMVDTLMKETKLEERAKRLDSVALTVISAFKAENWEKSVPNA